MTPKKPKKDSVKEAEQKLERKTNPKKEAKARRAATSSSQWRLSIAYIVEEWSQSTKSVIDKEHDDMLCIDVVDPAVTNLPVGGRGWGKAFSLPKIQLPEFVLAQLRTLYVASKISPEAAASEVHKSFPDSVVVKYHCTAARVKSFFAQLTKAKKKNMDLGPGKPSSAK